MNHKEEMGFLTDDFLEDKAIVRFTTLAYTKMLLLVQGFPTEVGWHGLATRESESEAQFLVSDILVYPQQVSSALCTTDDSEYAAWLNGIPDAEFAQLRLHGHSHVNFDVHPSSVDLHHWEGLRSTVKPGDFYIFMITNKAGDLHMEVLDAFSGRYYDHFHTIAQIPRQSGELRDFWVDAIRVTKGDECNANEFSKIV